MNYVDEQIKLDIANEVFERQQKYIEDKGREVVRSVRTAWEYKNRDILEKYGFTANINTGFYDYSLKQTDDGVIVETENMRYEFPKDATKDGKDLTELSDLFLKGSREMKEEINESEDYKVWVQLRERKDATKEQDTMKQYRMDRLLKLVNGMEQKYFDRIQFSQDPIPKNEMDRAIEIFKNISHMTVDENNVLHYKGNDGKEVTIDRKDMFYKAAMNAYARYFFGTTGLLRDQVTYYDLEYYEKKVQDFNKEEKPVQKTGDKKIKVAEKDRSSLYSSVNRPSLEEMFQYSKIRNAANVQQNIYRLQKEPKGGIIKSIKLSLETRKFNKLMKALAVDKSNDVMTRFHDAIRKEVMSTYNKDIAKLGSEQQEAWWAKVRKDSLQGVIDAYLNPQQEEQVQEKMEEPLPIEHQEPLAIEHQEKEETKEAQPVVEDEKNVIVTPVQEEKVVPTPQPETNTSPVTESKVDTRTDSEKYNDLRSKVFEVLEKENLDKENFQNRLADFGLTNQDYKEYRSLKQQKEHRDAQNQKWVTMFQKDLEEERKQKDAEQINQIRAQVLKEMKQIIQVGEKSRQDQQRQLFTMSPDLQDSLVQLQDIANEEQGKTK